jgi:hypothetical protein
MLHGAACRLLEASGSNDSDSLTNPVRPVAMDAANAAAELAAQCADDSPGVPLRRTAAGGVRVRSEDGLGNFVYAATLVQLFLRRFALDDVIAFEWCLTCSVPCTDGYGGGATVISRDHIARFDTRDFVTAAVRQAKASRVSRNAGAEPAYSGAGRMPEEGRIPPVGLETVVKAGR